MKKIVLYAILACFLASETDAQGQGVPEQAVSQIESLINSYPGCPGIMTNSGNLSQCVQAISSASQTTKNALVMTGNLMCTPQACTNATIQHFCSSVCGAAGREYCR